MASARPNAEAGRSAAHRDRTCADRAERLDRCASAYSSIRWGSTARSCCERQRRRRTGALRGVDHLLAGGPEAQAKIKALIRAVAGRRADDALVAETAQRIAEIRGSPEGREGIAAFLEKRKASWCSPKS